LNPGWPFLCRNTGEGFKSVVRRSVMAKKIAAAKKPAKKTTAKKGCKCKK